MVEKKLDTVKLPSMIFSVNTEKKPCRDQIYLLRLSLASVPSLSFLYHHIMDQKNLSKLTSPNLQTKTWENSNTI